MADITLELNKAEATFAKPTLGLLNRQEAPLVVAVFRATFSRDATQVPATAFHAHVQTLFEGLGASGREAPDSSESRQICRLWVRRKWLILDSREDREEFYALTSQAQDAIDFVQNLGSERALLSESRIRTILEVARSSAMDANPDPEERLQRLNKQIIALTAERDLIADGGVVEMASDVVHQHFAAGLIKGPFKGQHHVHGWCVNFHESGRTAVPPGCPVHRIQCAGSAA